MEKPPNFLKKGGFFVFINTVLFKINHIHIKTLIKYEDNMALTKNIREKMKSTEKLSTLLLLIYSFKDVDFLTSSFIV
jgi:hypothetical protein